MQWVTTLASRLMNDGVAVTLDVWEVSVGDSIPNFMERGVRRSDRVIIVCTDEYVRKANAPEGGVGYESMMVTAEIVSNLGTKKFIPLVRNVSGTEKTPDFLLGRRYVDLSDDSDYEKGYEVLLKELHKQPPQEKPRLGRNPFTHSPLGTETEPTRQSSEPMVEIPDQVEDPQVTYEQALLLARRNDLLGWKLMARKTYRCLYALRTWGEKFQTNWPKEDKDKLTACDEAIASISPLLVMALVGVDSGRSELVDQRVLMDGILNMDDWVDSRLTAVVRMPEAIAYVYQGLHGAVSMNTGQLDVAMSLANMSVHMPRRDKRIRIRESRSIMGWPDSLGGNCITAWNYLSGAHGRWPWLTHFFATDVDYRIALAAYYIALNIQELAMFIAHNGQVEILQERYLLDIPLSFVYENSNKNRRAVTLLLRNQDSLQNIWNSARVTRGQMESYWPAWLSLCDRWFSGDYMRMPLWNGLPHKDIFEML